MRSHHSRRRWVMTLMISVGLTTAHAVADDGPQPAADVPAPVVVDPVPLNDPALATPSASDIPAVEQPVVADVPPAVAPAATPSCSCCKTACCTKKKKEAATAGMKGAYKGLFYANDFGYLDDPCYDGDCFPGDSLKGLCCSRLDVGGEARVRFHSEKAMRGLGLTGRDDDFLLTRLRLFANYRMNEYFRFYGEYIYADSGGEFFNNRPIEENRGDIQNLFFDANLTSRLTFRAGRQEQLYGNQRLLSPLDWANTRRTFDGFKLLYKNDIWSVDGFFVRPTRRTAANESKIDTTNTDIDLYGVYASRGDLSIGTLDTYYIGFENRIEDFSYHTIGSRVAGKTDRGTLYGFEGGYQFGKNSPGYGDHNAGFFTGGLGRQFNFCTRCGPWKPTVWLWYDWASGGDDIPAAVGDNGFHHLFPLAHKYNGFMDLFGRRNLNDVNAQFITPLFGSSRVKFLLWYHYFFLDQKTTPYSVVMTPYNAGNAAGDRDLGHEVDMTINVDVNPRNSVLLGYSYFFAGKYFDTTPGIPSASPPRADKDAQFFYAQYQMRF